MTKILYGNSEKRFLECEKMASRNLYRHFFRADFFMFILFISNHTVVLVQFEINSHLWVFQKAEIALAEAASAISAFWKTHSRANKLQTDLETLWSHIYIVLNYI